MSVDQITQAGKFLEEQLRLIDPKIIRTVYPEYWGFEGLYHTVVPNLPFGINKVYTTRIDSSGTAVNFGGKATDIPLASFGIDTDEYKTIVGILAAEWNWVELEQQQAAQSSGLPMVIQDVVQEYSNALERGLRAYVHQRTLFGDTTRAFTGLFNNPDVTIVTLTDNLYSMDPYDFDIYIKGLVKDFKKQTKLTSLPTELLCCSDLYGKFTDPIQTVGTTAIAGTNAYELLTDPSKGSNLKSINEVNELTYSVLEEYGIVSSGSNLDMFILYESSEDTLDKMMAPIYKTPPQLKDDGMTYRQTGMVALSEVRVKQPFRVIYYLYPTYTGE